MAKRLQKGEGHRPRLELPEGIAHSPRGPSAAHRWRNCKASVRMELGLPDEVGEDAIQGTVFHEAAADVLMTGVSPYALVGLRVEAEPGEIRPVTREMAQKMQMGLDLVWSLAEGAQLFVEQRVSLEEWVGPGEFGTSDAFIIDIERRRLVTFDWKWGAGVPVDPEWNDQAILYTLGVWTTHARAAFEEAGIEPEEIEVIIIIEQPRTPGGGGVWYTDMDTLLREGKIIRRDAEETLDPDAPFNPGEKQCKFCKAARNNTCKARARFATEIIGLDFDDLDVEFEVGVPLELPEARSLSPEARSQILLHQKLIESFFTQLHEEAMEDARYGRPTPGLKRVSGRKGARKWRDEKKAELLLLAELRSKAYNRKLLSPAQTEEEIGKALYQRRYHKFVDEGEAKPILVPEADSRPALPNIEQAFDDMMEE